MKCLAIPILLVFLWITGSGLGAQVMPSPLDTVPGAKERILHPWDKIDLSSEKMKAGYPFSLERKRQGKWWLMGAGAVVGGGTAVWLLTREDDKPKPSCTLEPIFTITPSTCGRADGAILLTVAGEPEVLYQWSTGATSAQISGLMPGSYAVTLTKADGSCETIKSFTVTDQQLEFQINSVVLESDCGRDNGTISVTVQPEENYSFFWSTGETSSDISGLPTGAYELTVTLGETCTSVSTYQIGEKEPSLMMDLTVTGGSCTGGGELVVQLANESGTGTIMLKVEGPEGAFQFALTPGMHKLTERMNISSGTYTLEAWESDAGESCSVRTEVTVPFTGIEISALDDSYQTQFETALEENCLVNDLGEELLMTGIKEETGGELTWTMDGTFKFLPNPGFSGMASFTYLVRDACDSTDEAVVMIDVLPKGCEFTVQITTFNASCGFNDGSARVIVNEPGNYNYTWENGETGQMRSDLSAGSYIIYIEDLDLGCIKEFEVIVTEDRAHYYRNLNVRQPVCATSGEIRFEAISPASGPLNMEVFHPGGVNVFFIEPGLIFLSDYVDMTEGTYKVNLFDEGIGPDCLDEFNASIGPMEIVEIALEGVIPPSSPTAMDGAIIGIILDPGAEPYSLYFNGQFQGNFSGPVFTVEGVGAGDHEVWIIDGNGCMSNILNVPVRFGGDPDYIRITGNLGMSGQPGTSEHPGVPTHPLATGFMAVYQKPLIPGFMYVQSGIIGSRGEVTLTGAVELMKEFRMSGKTFFRVKLSQGVIWNGENLEWHTRFGPGLRFVCPAKISWDLDCLATSFQEGWFASPSLSMNIPIRIKN